MTGPRSASPLASSGADWTGADIGGLHDLAATLHGYLPGIAGVAAALNQEVAQLTAGDQGWRGPVASAFTAAWQRDAVEADVLAQVVTWTGDVVGDLAMDLAAIEQRLGEAAHVAAAHGVVIGDDGLPPLVPGDDQETSGQYRARTYRLACDQAMADARQASERAAARLSDLYAVFTAGRESAARQVAGDPAGSIAGVAAADVVQAGLGDQAADPADGDAGHLWDSVL